MMATQPGTEQSKRDGLQTAFAFFVLPLLMVLAGTILFGIYSYCSFEAKTARDLLEDLRQASATRRWRAACALALKLDEKADEAQSSAFVDEMVAVYRASTDADPRIRAYLALALGRLQDSSAVSALASSSASDSMETRINALWALGRIAGPGVLPALDKAARSGHEELRKCAAFALGLAGQSEAIPTLCTMLEDPVEDVRWNAAIGLARLGDESGLPLLLRMLDRGYLKDASARAGDPTLTGEPAEAVILNALRALSLLDNGRCAAALAELRSGDSSPRVRAMAGELLRRSGAPGGANRAWQVNP